MKFSPVQETPLSTEKTEQNFAGIGGEDSFSLCLTLTATDSLPYERT